IAPSRNTASRGTKATRPRSISPRSIAWVRVRCTGARSPESGARVSCLYSRRTTSGTRDRGAALDPHLGRSARSRAGAAGHADREGRPAASAVGQDLLLVAGGGRVDRRRAGPLASAALPGVAGRLQLLSRLHGLSVTLTQASGAG